MNGVENEGMLCINFQCCYCLCSLFEKFLEDGVSGAAEDEDKEEVEVADMQGRE